jgi:hypothetical protein
LHSLPLHNRELASVILHFLFKNLAKCRDLNGAGIIDYEKCYKETMEEEIILVEPVGHLVFSVAMVLCHMKSMEINDSMEEEISTLMENLVTRMSQITTTDLGFVKISFSCVGFLF